MYFPHLEEVCNTFATKIEITLSFVLFLPQVKVKDRYIVVSIISGAFAFFEKGKNCFRFYGCWIPYQVRNDGEKCSQCNDERDWIVSQ